MVKLRAVLFLLAAAVFVMTGCGSRNQPQASAPDFDAYSYPADTYMARVDNCMILIDVSASMGEMIGNRSKLDIVRNFLHKMNLTLPEYPELKFAVRTFGHNPLRTISNTQLVRKLSPYRTSDLEQCVSSIRHTGGQSPMALAIDAAAADLKDADGETALLIFSDGNVAGSDAVKAAQGLKKEYGYRLSVYPVMIGTDLLGSRKMEEMAWVGQSGFFANAADIESRYAMSEFVRKIFLMPYPDTDGDTIVDIRDQCPDTPIGASVDGRGCWVLQNVEYAFDQSTIKPSYYPALDKVVDVLRANPKLKIEIEGHTDNIGADAYNTDLSLKRAESVKRYLIQAGITHDRLYTAGYGFSRPITANDTEEGRSLNRRVELRPIKIQRIGLSAENQNSRIR